jgi:hypothetical protein
VGELTDRFDIWVDAKATATGPVVMIIANARGQRIVEDS